MLNRKLIKKKNICIVCRNSIDCVKNFELRVKLLVLNYSFGLKVKQLLELLKRNFMICII